ncbi:hypothetical protein AOQ84DRAFT_288161, partial [Glonium stellatum]
VSCSFYCRYFVVGAVKFYDFVMLAALFLTWGICVINHYQVKFGTGRHLNDQPAVIFLLEGTLKSWYVYQLVYLVDLALVKFSILAFYCIIAAQKVFRIAVYTTMGIIAAFTIAMVFVNAFECAKPSDAWSVEILLQGSGSCRDLHPIYYGQAAFNILSDTVILVLPMPVLLSLQMHKNKRIALVGIFSVGFVAVIASIVRVYALHVWATGLTDTPYNGAYILLWSQIEINAAIISASIPSLKPLFKRTFGSTIRSYGGRYLNYGYGRSGVSKAETGAAGGSVALKSLPSSATMTANPLNRGKRSFSNESDEQVFFKDGLNTKVEGGEDLDKPWHAESTYTRGGRPGQILRSVTIETHSISGDQQRGPLSR